MINVIYCFSVVRDLYCTDDDITIYGYEAVTNTVFWIENIPRFYNVTVDQCLKLCDGMQNCVGTYHRDSWCSLTTSSRYNPHYKHWVVKKLDELESLTFTKLCVKGDSLLHLLISPLPAKLNGTLGLHSVRL